MQVPIRQDAPPGSKEQLRRYANPYRYADYKCRNYRFFEK